MFGCRSSTVYGTYLLHTSWMIANFIDGGPGNMANLFVKRQSRSSTCVDDLPIARDLASHWGAMG